ncbi:hypothetical protein B0H11DRAFT_1911726 [Mycena galericulata]|nr:hypothetical protein B0H11DRAFT_1911726 [Mycena galericulata]
MEDGGGLREDAAEIDPYPNKAPKYFDNQAASDCDKYGTATDPDCAAVLEMECQQQMGICTGAQESTILAIGLATLLHKQFSSAESITRDYWSMRLESIQSTWASGNSKQDTSDIPKNISWVHKLETQPFGGEHKAKMTTPQKAGDSEAEMTNHRNSKWPEIQVPQGSQT